MWVDINKLLNYEVTKISESALNKFRKNYLSKEEFDPEDRQEISSCKISLPVVHFLQQILDCHKEGRISKKEIGRSNRHSQ